MDLYTAVLGKEALTIAKEFKAAFTEGKHFSEGN